MKNRGKVDAADRPGYHSAAGGVDVPSRVLPGERAADQVVLGDPFAMGYDGEKTCRNEAHMQRNMDLVRAILLRIESGPSGWAPQTFGIQGFPPDQIRYHTHIMLQEGLLEVNDASDSENSLPEAVRPGPSPFPWQRPSPASVGQGAMPVVLTWKGHEFLDLARDPERWNRARAIIAKVGSAPISVWLKVLTDLTVKGIETSAANAG